MSTDRIPMSKEGYEKKKAELDHLKNVEMSKITEQVAEARAGEMLHVRIVERLVAADPVITSATMQEVVAVVLALCVERVVPAAEDDIVGVVRVVEWQVHLEVALDNIRSEIVRRKVELFL